MGSHSDRPRSGAQLIQQLRAGLDGQLGSHGGQFDGKIETFWKERDTRYWGFFCPLCRHPRRIPYRPRPGGPRHVIQVALTAAVVTCATWPLFGWKGLISFVPLWAGFEFFYRTRLRAVLPCSLCGFDPYLYLIDVAKARAEVEAFWRRKFAEKGVPYPEKKSPESAPRPGASPRPN